MTHDLQLEQALAGKAANLKCYSRKSAAKLLDCHISYIDKLIAAGKLESWKLGPKITRIPVTSIEQFLSRASTR